MLHIQHDNIRESLFDGSFGIERETLRVTKDGFLSHTVHPFSDDKNIVKDFCENQAEINTGVHKTAEGAIKELSKHSKRLKAAMPDDELLWMFSNPPFIRSSDDIPVARFSGAEGSKFDYRLYLSAKYGRYKMTLSGIHINYSFSDKLLEEDFALSKDSDFTEYKNRLYLKLKEALMEYGWIINLLLSASPLTDGSFDRPQLLGEDRMKGYASLRCSKDGYWNAFVPVFDFENIRRYAESINRYIDKKALIGVSELYYPIRLKPRGSNRLNLLSSNGVNHIEIRNVDLNPFSEAGLDVRDLRFVELLIIYLASSFDLTLSNSDQIRAVKNFRSAALYDIGRARILDSEGKAHSLRDAGQLLLDNMYGFFLFNGFSETEDILRFQMEKLTVPGYRYAEKVLDRFCGGFVRKGIDYLSSRQNDL